MADAQILMKLGIMLWVTTASSYLAMNFTGATPYTSLSGVEQEMRKGLPFQLIGACATNCPTEAIFVNPDDGCGCAALIINRWISKAIGKPISSCGC